MLVYLELRFLPTVNKLAIIIIIIIIMLAPLSVGENYFSEIFGSESNPKTVF